MPRLRRLLRSVRRAPWGAAAPLAIVMSVVLAVGLVVADGGGWRSTIVEFGVESGATLLGIGDGGVVGTFSSDDGAFGIPTLLGESAAIFLLFTGGLFVTIFGLLAILAASRGRRLPVVALVLLMGVALAGFAQARLGYTTVLLREAQSSSTGAGELAVSITTSAIVALLLGVALVVGLWWWAAARRAHRRGASWSRPSWGASMGLLLIAVLVTLALPRVGRWLRDAGESVLGTPSGATEAFETGGQQTVYLFVAAAIALMLASALLPRRAPALALASAVVLAALWMPAGWVFSVAIPEAIIDSGAGVLLYWAAWIAIGIAGTMTVALRTATPTETTPTAT